MAPAVVKASSLMRISPLVLPTTSEVVAVVDGNTLLTIGQITREALRIMDGKLVFTSALNSGYESKYRDQVMGDRIIVRKPTMFTVKHH